MCIIEYRVSGEDVNDHMVMESHAYYTYSLRHIFNFLYNLGFSKQKLNKMKVHIYERKSNIEIFRPLMFGNNFKIDIEIRRLDHSTGFFIIKYNYLNSDNKLSATIKSELQIKMMENDYGIARKIIDQIHIFSN